MSRGPTRRDPRPPHRSACRADSGPRARTGCCRACGPCGSAPSTNSAVAPDQGGLAGDEPAARLAVVVQRASGRGPPSPGRHSRRPGRARQRVESTKHASSIASNASVGPVVGLRGEQIHADGAGGQHPLAVLDERAGLLRRAEAGRSSASRSVSASARAEGNSVLRLIAGTGEGRRCRRWRGSRHPARPDSSSTGRQSWIRHDLGAIRAQRPQRPVGAAEERSGRPNAVRGAVTGQSSSTTRSGTGALPGTRRKSVPRRLAT